MELIVYVLIFLALTILPEILGKSKKKKKEYEYPDFDDIPKQTKKPGKIIIKTEDTYSTSEGVYFDLEDFFKDEYKEEVEVKEEPKLTATQKKYLEYLDKSPEEKTLKETKIISEVSHHKNGISKNNIVQGFIFSEIVMKPRAYRPFRGPNS